MLRASKECRTELKLETDPLIHHVQFVSVLYMHEIIVYIYIIYTYIHILYIHMYEKFIKICIKIAIPV